MSLVSMFSPDYVHKDDEEIDKKLRERMGVTPAIPEAKHQPQVLEVAPGVFARKVKDLDLSPDSKK